MTPKNEKMVQRPTSAPCASFQGKQRTTIGGYVIGGTTNHEKGFGAKKYSAPPALSRGNKNNRGTTNPKEKLAGVVGFFEPTTPAGTDNKI